MAPPLLETTVAAPQTPILRASVNVERGRAHGPAKVGNCHTNSAAQTYIRDRVLVEDRGYSTPCWIWQRTKNEKGYGRTEFGGIKNLRVHRLSYEAYVGPIPDGLQIDHLCFVTSCVNPAHLEPVTGEENVRRRVARNTHCPNGHEYTAETVRIVASGARRCLLCIAAWRVAQRKVAPGANGRGGSSDRPSATITRTQDHGFALHDFWASRP